MEPIKLGRYRHFKGNEYEVVGLAKHSETLEDMVVYRALYGAVSYTHLIRQRRAVAGHAVVEVAAHEQRRAAKKPVVHHALEQIPLTSALFILHEAL